MFPLFTVNTSLSDLEGARLPSGVLSSAAFRSLCLSFSLAPSPPLSLCFTIYFTNRFDCQHYDNISEVSN